jgi:hypothetical protein
MIKICIANSLNDSFKDADTICYCFGYTKKDIENDYLGNVGRSTIFERIVKERQAGGCNCADTNPKGR